MKTRAILLAVGVLVTLAPAGAAKTIKDYPPLDYGAYYSVLPKMKEVSEKSNESIRTLHTLMTELEQCEDEKKAAGIRAQIRPVLLEHRALKVQMFALVDKVLMKPPPVRTDLEALRALRNTTLRQVRWTNAFLKYVARDISQAIGVPILLNARVQELNQVELYFPEISAEAVLDLICQNFDLRYLIFGGEIIVFRKLTRTEERFREWEKKHGKVDWIAEDKAGTYDSDDVETKEAKRKLKKLEDMDLPLLKQNMTKLYIMEGQSELNENRLKMLEFGAKYIDMIGGAKSEEELAEALKRHKHVLHYMTMERENSVEVYEVLSQVLGMQLELPEDNEELRRILKTEIPKIEWVEKELEEALNELGRIAGVPVETDLPPFLEMVLDLSVENVTLETVISLICDIHPLDWRYVNGRLFFAHVAGGK